MSSVRSHYNILAVLLFALFSYALIYIHSPESLPGDSTEADAVNDASRLNVIVPASDTVTVEMGRHRVAANTLPGARAFLNDEEVHVYPNGAFAGLLDVSAGQSTSEIRVILPNGDTLRKTVAFHRPEPAETIPEEPLVISRDMMKPSQILELDEGDELEVRFKGSTGGQAYFNIEGVVEQKPMQELPRSQTGGIGGIYSGRYVVNAGDDVHNVAVEFTLENGQEQVTAETGAIVSLTSGAFPKVAETQGRRLYLNLEPETDRLGGNALEYLEEGIRLEVTGRRGRFYRVRLSERMDAYLSRYFAEILPGDIPRPRSQTGSISVNAFPDYDAVAVSLGTRLPYSTTMKTDPNLIEVDIFGAGAPDGTVFHDTLARGIRNVETEQVDEHHLRLRIHLDHDLHWGYHAEYGVGSSLLIKVRRPPRLTSLEHVLKNLVIAVDVGHGGSNTGGRGATGTNEKDIVLDIAERVRKQLEAEEARVIMTREGDRDVSMADRAEKIIASGAHVLVSIHANSISYATNPLAIHGTSNYYHHDGFRPFARTMHRHMLELPLQDFGLFGNFNFSLNALTELPNVLVETAFISHPEDEIKLLDPDFREQIAGQIIGALCEYFRKHGDPSQIEAGDNIKAIEDIEAGEETCHHSSS